MCIDADLFGDVIVNISDVNLWLDTTVRMTGRTKTSREHYAQFYDVANKIKQSKLDGSFYLLIAEHEADKNYDEQPLSLYQTVYKSDIAIDEIKPVCPSWFHVCYDVNCAVYITRTSHEKHRNAYKRRKARA